MFVLFFAASSIQARVRANPIAMGCDDHEDGMVMDTDVTSIPLSPDTWFAYSEGHAHFVESGTSAVQRLRNLALGKGFRQWEETAWLCNQRRVRSS